MHQRAQTFPGRRVQHLLTAEAIYAPQKGLNVVLCHRAAAAAARVEHPTNGALEGPREGLIPGGCIHKRSEGEAHRATGVHEQFNHAVQTLGRALDAEFDGLKQ